MIFLTLSQAMELYHPLALRLFLIGTHYRSPINYSVVQLESASERIFYIYQVLQLSLSLSFSLSLHHLYTVNYNCMAISLLKMTFIYYIALVFYSIEEMCNFM